MPKHLTRKKRARPAGKDKENFVGHQEISSTPPDVEEDNDGDLADTANSNVVNAADNNAESGSKRFAHPRGSQMLNELTSSRQSNDKGVVVDEEGVESAEKSNEEKIWVQCNACEKWRSLPGHVDPKTLPEVWSCELNSYDLLRNKCAAPEENYNSADDQKHTSLKRFVKLWTKRLQNADRAEHKLSTGSMTRGRKRKSEVEWIQCCNPSCGKWRSIARFVDSDTLLKKLHSGRSSSSGGNAFFMTHSDDWFCSMNFWDDTTASCAAPQEQLATCRWNLSS